MKNMSSLIILVSGLLTSSWVCAQGVSEILRGGSGTWTASSFSEKVVGHSPTIKQSRQKIDATKSQLEQAKIAMWPRLVLVARYTRISETTNDPLFAMTANPNSQALVGGVDDPEAQQLWINLGQQNAALSNASILLPENHWSFDAELRLPITDWFASLGPMRNAVKSRIQSESATVVAQENGLRFQARAIFYALIQKRTIVKLEEDRLIDAKEKFRVIGAAFSAGAAKRSDLLRLQSFVFQVEASLSSAQADAVIALENARALTGENDDYLTGEDVLETLDKVNPDTKRIRELAVANRSEIKAMDAGKKSLNHVRDAASGSRWPTLEVIGKATLANPNPRFTPSRDGFDPTWEASAVLSWSPNLLFLNNAKRDSIQAQVIEVESQEQAFVDQLLADIAGAVAKDKSNLDVIVSAKKVVDALTEVYALRQKEFQAGAITLTEVLSAETELKEAKTGWINANIQARVTRAKLAWLTGGAVSAP